MSRSMQSLDREYVKVTLFIQISLSAFSSSISITVEETTPLSVNVTDLVAPIEMLTNDSSKHRMTVPELAQFVNVVPSTERHAS